jgi:hypothetical protein
MGTTDMKENTSRPTTMPGVHHSRVLSLSDAQMQEVRAAAAVLRVTDRDSFLRDVADRLMLAQTLTRHTPTDDDVVQAIRATIGIQPYQGMTEQEAINHGQNPSTQTNRR